MGPGGGFSDTAATRQFFRVGKKFRTGGFLATSFSQRVAQNIFIQRVRHAICARQHTPCENIGTHRARLGLCLCVRVCACLLVRACRVSSSFHLSLIVMSPPCKRARARPHLSGHMLVRACVPAQVPMWCMRAPAPLCMVSSGCSSVAVHRCIPRVTLVAGGVQRARQRERAVEDRAGSRASLQAREPRYSNACPGARCFALALGRRRWAHCSGAHRHALPLRR